MKKNKELFNEMMLGEPDLYLKLCGDYKVKVWRIIKDAYAADDFVVKLPLKGKLEITYTERIFGKENERLRIFYKRLPDIKEAILNTLLKRYAVKLKISINKPE